MCDVLASRLLALDHRVRMYLSRHALPEDLDLDLRSRPESDRQVAVGDVAPDREAVCAAGKPADARTIGIYGLSTVNREVLLVADQQSPQAPRDARRPGGHQRVPPVEIAVVEADAEPKPGLQRIVQQGEVGAVVAVTLLHPQRVQRSVATRPDTKPAAGGHQAIPPRDRQTGLDVKLPTELADVRDTLSEDVEAADTDAASLHEREAAFRDVVIGQATQDHAGLRSPHPDDAQVLRRLADLDGPVLLALLQAQPPEVAVHVPGAGDQPEPLLTEPRDGDVPGDPAAPVEQLGVDHAANRPVDAIPGDTLEQGQRSLTVQLDLPERRHVDDPHAFPEGAVILRLQPEPA